MKTKITDFCGVTLVVPDEPWFFWPVGATPAKFPSCCGPGPSGSVGEKLIPENVDGLSMSPACWVHDLMFRYGKGRREFNQANSTFLENMWRINDQLGGDIHAKLGRIPEIYAYYTAVDSAAGYFFFCKSEP